MLGILSDWLCYENWRSDTLYIASLYGLKATQMNVQHSLISELILNEFELGYNTVKATKTFVILKMKVQLVIVQ